MISTLVITTLDGKLKCTGSCYSAALLLLKCLLLAGCASTAIVEGVDVDRSLQVNTVRQHPSDHQGATIQWGGTIVSIENLADETQIEVIARPLFRGGLPDARRFSTGRFMAIVEGFLDPADYTKNRSLTVVGDIDGLVDGKIGKANYSYPRVVVAAHKLWLGSSGRCSDIRSARYMAGHGAYFYNNRWAHPFGHDHGHGVWLDSWLFDFDSYPDACTDFDHHPKGRLRFNFFWHN